VTVRTDNQRFRPNRVLVFATVGIAVVVAVVLAFAVEANDSSSPKADSGATCVFTGTPAPQPSPIDATNCTPGEVGTPVTADDLAVTLTLSSNKAAPQNVTVTIVDTQGHPVTGATVTLVNTHLEMHHGDFVHLLPEQGNGVYAADGIGMGMGGRWQTMIEIERPGQPEVDVIFLVTLEGLA